MFAFLLESPQALSNDKEAAQLESAKSATGYVVDRLEEARAREKERQEACQAWGEAYEQSRKDGLDYWTKKKAAEEARRKADETGKREDALEANRAEDAADEAGEKAQKSQELAELRRKVKDEAAWDADLVKKDTGLAVERVQKAIDEVSEKKFPEEKKKLQEDLDGVRQGLKQISEEPQARCGPDNFATLLSTGQIKAANRGTGETIGHIADLILTNLTPAPLTIYLPPTVLTSISKKNQSYTVYKPHTVTLSPGETGVLSLTGVCLDANLPPVPADVMNDLKVEDPQTPDFERQWGKKLRKAAAISKTVKRLQSQGKFKTHYSKDKKKEEEILMQWTVWKSVAEMEGRPFPKSNLENKMLTQAGQARPLTKEDEKELKEGAGDIWDCIELTGKEAKLLESKTEEATGPQKERKEGGPGETTIPTPKIPVTKTPPPTTIPDPKPCTIPYEWHRGPAIKVLKYGSYPSGIRTLSFMRPGDLIGFSVLAEDLDILVQKCVCPTGTDIKKHKPTPDRVQYEWQIEGPGKLIQVGGSESNSVLYQVPYCLTDQDANNLEPDKITVRITGAGKAEDEAVRVVFDIKKSVRVSPYVEVTTRDVVLNIEGKILDEPKDEKIEESPGPCCVYEEPYWMEGTPLDVEKTNITIRMAPENYPDNLALLHAMAHDGDVLVLRCDHQGRLIEEKLENVYDDCKIKWSVIKGVGDFPLGDEGPAVVFRHSSVGGGLKNDVVLQCTITDSGTEFSDTPPPQTLTKSHAPRLKPLALIGIGDYSTIAFEESHKEFIKQVGENARKNYETAGYDVLFYEEIDRDQLRRSFQNPRLQAAMLMGHGTADGLTLPRSGAFVPGDIGAWTGDKWGCKAGNNSLHPALQELILLGCNMRQANWSAYVFSLWQYFGFNEKIVSKAGVLSFYIDPIRKYVDRQHKPLRPRILD